MTNLTDFTDEPCPKCGKPYYHYGDTPGEFLSQLICMCDTAEFDSQLNNVAAAMNAFTFADATQEPERSATVLEKLELLIDLGIAVCKKYLWGDDPPPEPPDPTPNPPVELTYLVVLPGENVPVWPDIGAQKNIGYLHDGDKVPVISKQNALGFDWYYLLVSEFASVDGDYGWVKYKSDKVKVVVEVIEHNLGSKRY